MTNPTATDNDRFLAALALERYRDTAKRREADALFKAIVLAPTLEIGEALLRGETVPAGRLDPVWRKAYGL